MFCDRDVICFLGDSITAGGLWVAEIYQNLRKKQRVKCYNCGVAGATATMALTYLHSECLRYNPDVVAISFGINDIDRWLYADTQRALPEREARMQEAIERHTRAYEEILRHVTAAGARAIVCLSVPYDERSESCEENLKCQRGLDAVAARQRVLAEKYGCAIVDFKATMQGMLGTRAIMEADRVHPTPEGHHVMAQTFLRDTGVQTACDFDKPFVFEDWNRARYDAEQRLQLTNFVEFCALHDAFQAGKTYEEKKRIAAERYEESENKDEYIPRAYAEYIETIDDRQRLLGEVVKKTVY